MNVRNLPALAVGAVQWIKQMQSEIEKQKRRDELRKGSIDVEFRVIK